MKPLSITGLFLALLVTGTLGLYAQVGINNDGSSPDNSAILDAKSTTKGFLPPRMNSVQRSAIGSPATGLVIFNTDCNDLQLFNGNGWVPLGNNGMLQAPGAISGNVSPCVNAAGAIYSVSPVEGAAGYHWTVPAGAIITAGQGTRSVTVTFGTTGGYVCAAPFNDCYRGTVACLAVGLQGAPASPVAGTHVATATQVTWTWNAVAGATGYKWSMTNDYATATDLGTVTSTTETGLACNTAYTRYAWAYNTCGNSTPCTLTQATSPCSQWACGQPITDSRDGKSYATVMIGTQCWMAQGLDYGTKISGTSSQTDNGIPEKYCYNNDDQNCTVYGALYQWGELMQYVTTPGAQGLCPAGWHIPGDDEWTVLSTFLGGEAVAGGKIKEAGTAHWQAPNTGATNSSGFTALPGGYRDTGGSFNGLSSYLNYWSSSPNGTTEAWDRHLNYFSEYIARGNYSLSYGFYARCVKDAGGSTTTPTMTTSDVTGITQSSATCGGNVTSDGGASVTARGVCWGTAQNPDVSGSHTTDGTGTGAFVSSLTGLSPGTPYYVRAYATNSAGTGYGEQKTFTTTVSPVFTCGSPILVNHVAGAIAPVTKSVTYGTVTNIPGETAKCWITRNLGASQQATAVNDATEASAGWYWQFNRKQGYKHDGTTRTPNTAWITPINENSDWTSLSDPCAIELGTNWRIPTSTEWTNVDVSGSWANWNDPWNSSLKLHAAGQLLNSTGSLQYRGLYGFYWSSKQNDVSNAFYIYLSSGSCGIYGDSPKDNGFPLRCLKDAGGSTSTPTVTTSDVTGTTQSTATCGGNVTSDGGSAVTARGVCWSTSQNPTVSGSHTTDGTGTGAFVSSLTGLSPGTPYYVRAYATNSAGTSYGDQVSFTTNSSSGAVPCPGVPSIIDVRDGTVYQTVLIGTQCWLLQNLNYGSQIPHSTAQTNNGVPEKYCYGDNATHCASVGGMYLWNEVMQYTTTAGAQGLCPAGWHLPTDAEWSTLTTFLGGESVAGGKLKETGTTHWGSPNTGATNESGFTALPGGIWDNFTWFFVGSSSTGKFWTSSPNGDSSAWIRSLNYASAGVFRETHTRVDAISVRCLKD